MENVTVKLMLLLLLLAVESYSNSVPYRKFKVYQVIPKTKQHFHVLQNLKNSRKADFWFELEYEPTMVMVAPHHQEEFETILLQKSVPYKLIIKNLEKAIEKENTKQRQKKEIKKGAVAFDRYMRYAQIQDYLQKLGEDYQDLVTVETYGSSYENRNLTCITISKKNGGNNPIIFIDAGIHAREWIAPAQALYIIEQLVKNPKNQALIDNVIWIIAPLVNPDGYEYSHLQDRYWRKSRTKGVKCDGVDLNRNFDYHWLGKGAESSECSPVYAGRKPFSEPESLALSKIISRSASRTKLYITFHSPFKALLYPYGYTADLPENNKELFDLGTKVIKSIYKFNETRYKIGTSVRLYSYTAGNSRDWAYGVANIKLSYTMELPPNPCSDYDIPSDKIQPVVAEAFEGIKTFHQYVQSKFAEV